MPENRGSKNRRSSGLQGNSQGKSNEELRREHRAERQRQQKRRRTIFYCVLGLLVVIIGIVLSLTVFFSITDIKVEADSIYIDEEIIASSGVKNGDNLFLVSKDQVEARIVEKLPFIGEVKFSKKLPGTLIITVTETYVSAAVEYEDGYILIDSTGKVLAEVSTLEELYENALIPEKESSTESTAEGSAEEGTEVCPKYVLGHDKIIIIKGLTITEIIPGLSLMVGDERVLEIYREIMASLEKNEIVGITEIDITDTVNVKLIYQDRIEILVGSVSNLDNKLALCREALKNQDEISPYQKGTVNLTIDKQAYFSPYVETTTMVPATEPQTELVTDENGETVTDANGHDMTRVVTTKPSETEKLEADDAVAEIDDEEVGTTASE